MRQTNGRLVACIEQWHLNPWNYAAKYERAADELLLAVRERSLPIDTVAQPIAFLYLHAFELSIKGFIAAGNCAKSGAYDFRHIHGLQKLWAEAKPFVDSNFQVFNPAEKPTIRCRIELIDSIVDKIDEYDPDSFAFRYHIDKKHQPTLRGFAHLDFNKLSKDVKDAIHFLGGMANDIHNAITLRSEDEAGGLEE